MIDTDIMVDLLRQHQPAVKWLDSLGDDEILLTALVVMELIQGCRPKAEQKRLHKALASYRIVWPLPEVCDEALAIFSRLHLSHGLGLLDALIGQLAVSLDVSLCSFTQNITGQSQGFVQFSPTP